VGALKLYKEQNNTSVKGALGLYVGFKKGCAGAYRYGFNGQEKVDEISGVGNHNTALFWEYDTRLGRRWNVDPVMKPWRSPFDAFNNNPIIMIDPNGDDDFFHLDGTVTHKKTKINIIRIGTEKDNVTLYEYLASSAHKLEDKFKLAERIANHYAPKAGISKKIDIAFNVSKEKNPMWESDGNITVNFGMLLYSINSFNNSANLINTFVHEKAHINKPIKTFKDHAETYCTQVTDPSFSETDDAHQLGTIIELSKRILNSLVQDYDGDGSYSLLNNVNSNGYTASMNFTGKIHKVDEKGMKNTDYTITIYKDLVPVQEVKYEKLLSPNE
jgi:Metallopeptidase toxin 2